MTSRFLVCIHDSTPAFAQETRAMLKDLAPLIGRRLAFGVVPNWRGQWPLAAAPEYCRLIRENSEELLLHGYFHERRRGAGPVTWLTNAGDEMNGLTPEETRRVLDRGQRDFIEAFGEPARGFLAPAWQEGQLHSVGPRSSGLEYSLRFFSVESHAGRRIPLTTWTWDCGRWGWLGHVGHGLGRFAQFLDRGVPALAIHPRDLQRGYWPAILGVTQELLDRGYEPSTPSQVLEAGPC